MKRSSLLFFLGLLFFAFLVSGVGKEEIHPYYSCSKELKNPQKTIHLVVENCTNIGTFSLGGLYKEKWEKLTFLYPLPWEGTFFTLKVDEKLYANSPIPEISEENHLDKYIIKPPYLENDQIKATWLLPEKILLEEIFSLDENGTFIKFKIKNQGNNTRKVGLRLHLDTMVGENDGAPIYLPGKGLITQEKAYQNINFNYWKAYNKKDNPTVISTGVFSGVTLPDKIIIANWRRSTHSLWEYFPQDISILGDSAVLLYFNEQPLSPKKEREITAYYGKSTPILPEKKEMGIGEIVSEKKSYCPQEKIKISVDLVNRGITKQDKYVLSLIIYNSSQQKIFSSVKSLKGINSDSVKTINFEFIAPPSGYPLTAETILFVKGKQLDKKSKSLIYLRRNCQPVLQKPRLNLSFFILLLLLLLVVISLIAYSLKFKRAKILFKKINIKGKIRIIVENQTNEELKNIIIKDKLPSEDTEIDISTLGVVRSRDILTWEIGNLKPQESAILEYKIKSPFTELPQAKLLFNSQQKKSSIS